MIDLVHRFIIPAAYAVLPPKMASANASALLIAIGLQESGFQARRQQFGPARGFWQFEVSGVRGVLHHPKSRAAIENAIVRLGYGTLVDEDALHDIAEHNDILAACFARALLWTLPGTLPGPDELDVSWALYERGWRPGRPRPTSWPANYRAAWAHVTVTTPGSLSA